MTSTITGNGNKQNLAQLLTKKVEVFSAKTKHGTREDIPVHSALRKESGLGVTTTHAERSRLTLHVRGADEL